MVDYERRVSMPTRSRKVLRNAVLATSVGVQTISNQISLTNLESDAPTDENIVITGGGMDNKGAQAMTFTVVDQLSERYPEKDLYLLSGREFKRDHDEYCFGILPWGPEIQLSLLSKSGSSMNTAEYSRSAKERVKEVIDSCAFIVDVSGFKLTSQFGARTSFSYLSNIVVAEKYDIPMYIFPQSIGPFDYSQPSKFVLEPLLRSSLAYPELICPREQHGVNCLSRYTTDNVEREFDIVLQNEEYDLRNIYSGQVDPREPNVDSGGVGIIPNSKVFERTNPEDIYALYEESIQELLQDDRTVYVLRHSREDLDICEEIKNRFREEENVVLLSEDFSAVELENIITQFDFLIASRYHSIVHAYKNRVPVIAIGWAVKYKELLNEFQQSSYFFEGRDSINADWFVSVVDKMASNWMTESEKIDEKLAEIREETIFERVFES